MRKAELDAPSLNPNLCRLCFVDFAGKQDDKSLGKLCFTSQKGKKLLALFFYL